MKLERDNICPVLSSTIVVDGKPQLHEVKCLKLRCMWFQQLRGKNPQTSEPVEEWDCAINWQTVVGLEGSQMTRQAGAAIESFRNEVVDGNAKFLSIIGNQPKRLVE